LICAELEVVPDVQSYLEVTDIRTKSQNLLRC